jgi:hypothetical protein
MTLHKKTRKGIGKFGGEDKHDFIDTADKAKERLTRRLKLQEILEKELKQERLAEAVREKNRKIGQLSIFDGGEVRTLSHFMKKPNKRK